MLVERRRLLPVCLAILFSCLAPRLCIAQQAPAEPAAAKAAPAGPVTQAYTLPPDKLAKAIAINRIWNILDKSDPKAPFDLRAELQKEIRTSKRDSKTKSNP